MAPDTPGGISYPQKKSHRTGRSRLEDVKIWSHDPPFARTYMVDFVRSDAGGFLTGSMIAMLILCTILFVAGRFN
jgi:hypothetical protein